MCIYYLYVKTHIITGLKYLGQTKRNPHKYIGSGKYWLAHLNKYGNEITTEILHECDSKEELKERGLYYSVLWDIVESDNWANLRPESGDGGKTISGPSHHMARPEYKEMLKNIWNEEKRKVASAKTALSHAMRSDEMRQHIHELLSASWNDSRKEDHRQAMIFNNPMKDQNNINKMLETKSAWSDEYRKEVINKTSGKNNYKNKPDYDKESQSGKNAPHVDNTIYNFLNKKTGSTEIMTRLELEKKYKLHQGNLGLVIRGKRSSVSGWSVIK